jgi:hypothetical protein
MVCQINLGAIYGEIVGYRPKLNPASVISYVIVKVGNRNINIQVDSRQSKFIQKEYPVGSTVELKFDGHWHIISQESPPDCDIDAMAPGAF